MRDIPSWEYPVFVEEKAKNQYHKISSSYCVCCRSMVYYWYAHQRQQYNTHFSTGLGSNTPRRKTHEKTMDGILIGTVPYTAARCDFCRRRRGYILKRCVPPNSGQPERGTQHFYMCIFCLVIRLTEHLFESGMRCAFKGRRFRRLLQIRWQSGHRHHRHNRSFSCRRRTICFQGPQRNAFRRHRSSRRCRMEEPDDF